jgi:hypothetical protein
MEKQIMKTAIAVTALVLSGVLCAQAGPANEVYRDLVRPHGHKRSDAIYQADLDACYGQTGAIRSFADAPAFKECMLHRGYRWIATRVPPSVGKGPDWTDFLPCCGQ